MRRTVAGLTGALLAAGAAIAVAAPAEAAGTAPRISAVGPNNGSTLGGTRVTITGSHFARGMTVAFGTTRGSSVRVISSGKLQVTAPKHAAGTLDVTVHTKAGTSRRYRTDRFTYVSPPSISSLAPNSALTAQGGTRITVTGRGFTGVTAVRFGTAAGLAVKVLSSTSLQVTAPPHPSGSYDVRVVNKYGTSAVVSGDHVAYSTFFTASTAIKQDDALSVSAYGLRPGTQAVVTLDDSTDPLDAKVVAANGSALFGVAVTGQVADGAHVVHLAAVDGTGAPATFDGDLQIDATPPAVDGVTVAADPASDAVHPGGTITVSAHVTDDGGVSAVVLEVDAPGRSMICGHAAATLTDGTVNDGTWSTTCVLPSDAPIGTYSVSPWGSDIAGNPFTDDGLTFDVTPAPTP